MRDGERAYMIAADRALGKAAEEFIINKLLADWRGNPPPGTVITYNKKTGERVMEKFQAREEPVEFMVGDMITCRYYTGRNPVVLHPAGEDAKRMGYDFYFQSPQDKMFYVTRLGKVSSYHDNRIIDLVERPKKKVKKTFWFASWCFGSSLRRYSGLMSIDRLEVERDLLATPVDERRDLQIHSIELEIDT